MKAPLTAAALTKIGVTFGVQFREETAAGFITRSGYKLRGNDDRKALLTWIMTHLPDNWDDAATAERLPAIVLEYEPQLPALRAAMDRPGYQTVLRSACAALFA